ncbi:hypothetical protein G7009_01965 [Pseudomonas capeferrum]|uniref:hypothetical protein n=1 Tax=Pseudomonas capeferrum TaxID=1495066 RepID=UPI0015E41C31|nr:hypothetical protein [Pseudomonas capeferrum]MBA1200565.1 hypothetical protein [Pseudomonas capeferrum]
MCDDDIPEPEHDHLLDHEFLYADRESEADAQPFDDLLEEGEESLDDPDERDHPAWQDDYDD